MAHSYNSRARILRRRQSVSPWAGRCLCGVAMLAMLGGATNARAAIRVVTTTPGYADIVKQIGKDLVSVSSVMRGPENPHNVRPRPSQMMKVKRAKLFIHSGLDGEAWAPLLVKGARNPHLLAGQPGNVDVSRGIRLKEVPKKGQLTRALGDIHVYGNPHYALDPLNIIIIARTITDALKRIEPASADTFEANYKAYAQRVRQLSDRLVAQMKPYRGTHVVTYHRAWPYFLDRFGLISIGEVEPKPGISPGPRHLLECVERMRSEDARVIIVETYNSLDNAKTVATRAGGKAIVLAQEVNAISGVDTYEKLFDYNVRTLLDTFKELGIQPKTGQ